MIARTCRLASLLLFVLPPAMAASAQQPGPAEVVVRGDLALRIDSMLTAAVPDGFAGVVLVAKDGQVVLTKGYGLANRRTNVPFSPATVVQIGSNTKAFTAVAILQLVERGHLQLDDPLSKLLPSFPPDKLAITVRQLLTHTSGLPTDVGPDFEELSRSDFLKRVAAARLVAAPGTSEHYSNAGYSLLAALIEILARQSYDRYVANNILQRLDLHDTGYLIPAFDRGRIAHGYLDGVDQGIIIEKPHDFDGPWWNLRGNGGLLSTVSDMYRFYEALFNTELLLKRASRDVLFPADKPIGLAGSDGTEYFLYVRRPEQRTVLVFASNAGEELAQRVSRRLLPLIRGEAAVAAAPAPAQDAPQRAEAERQRQADDDLKRRIAAADQADSLRRARMAEARRADSLRQLQAASRPARTADSLRAAEAARRQADSVSGMQVAAARQADSTAHGQVAARAADSLHRAELDAEQQARIRAAKEADSLRLARIAAARRADSLRGRQVETPRQTEPPAARAPEPVRAVEPAPAAAVPLPAAETAGVTGTPETQAVAEYIAVYNQGDAGAMQRFIETRGVRDPKLSTEDRVVAYVRSFNRTGRITPIEVSRRGGTIVVRVNTEGNETLVFLFDVESAAPYRIRALGLQP
ncbi:MAG: serine hydrolase [Gemmatimonadota bacterium]